MKNSDGESNSKDYTTVPRDLGKILICDGTQDASRRPRLDVTTWNRQMSLSSEQDHPVSRSPLRSTITMSRLFAPSPSLAYFVRQPAATDNTTKPFHSIDYERDWLQQVFAPGTVILQPELGGIPISKFKARLCSCSSASRKRNAQLNRGLGKRPTETE